MTSAQATLARPSIQLVLSSLLRADFAVLVNNRRALAVSTGLPIFLLIVTHTPRDASHLGGPAFIIGLAITVALLATGLIGYALSVARDREQGVFQRLRVTPAPTWTIMFSRLVVQTVANLVIALIVTIVGDGIHHLSLSAGDYLLILAVSVLAGAVFLALGQALVGLVRSADTVNAAGRVLFIALFFLGLFGQSGTLGAAWESIARWTPVGAVMNLYAGVLNITAWDSRDWLSVLACAGYILAFTAVGIRWFRWEAR